MADTEFKYDVFISYSHKDEKWVVETLLKRLDDSGLKVCIDYRDFEAGKMALLNMQDAAKQSQHVVLVLTKNWLGSEWSLFEALMGGTKDPAGLQKKLIPLLCEAGIEKDINDFIAMRTWVDFTRKDREVIAWKQLFSSLGKPDTSTLDTGTPLNWNLKHRYGLASNFTGRVDECRFLTNWLENNNEQPLLVLRALGGFGKSALTWFWLLHDVDKSKWTRAVWWSFYDDTNFESFLKETLEYLKVDVPQGPRQQVDVLLKVMEQQNILLVMDGFERTLRAFSSMGAAYQLDDGQEKHDDHDLDCVSPIAEDFLRNVASSGGLMKAKILMTTRLTPRILFVGANVRATRESPLQGMIEHELLQMEPADAVDFFIKQGIRGTRTEIERACSLYGFHPLSLRLLAGLIIKDKRQPMDIGAASRYEKKVSDNVIQRQHHVLEQSYEGLSLESKVLLGRIACFRSSVTFDTLVAITDRGDPSGTSNESESIVEGRPYDLDDSLDDLTIRGLLHCTITPNPDSKFTDSQISTFDLHPIVRRYVYDRLTAPERTDIHSRLIDYFEAVPEPQMVENLEDLALVIELYHHTVRAGKFDEAVVLFHNRMLNFMYYQFGAYQIIIELLFPLFTDGESNPPKLSTKRMQSWASTVLGAAYNLFGQPGKGVLLSQVCVIIDESENDKENLAIDLGNMGCRQIPIGALGEAERNLRRSIDLCLEIEAEFHITASEYRDFGQVSNYCGNWQEAERNLSEADNIFKKGYHVQGQSTVWSNRAWRFLLIARANPQSKIPNLKSSIECAVRALELANEEAKRRYQHPRDYVRAYWLLGAANCENGDLTKADENLSKAINICRQINMVDHEADILLELAKLRRSFAIAQDDKKLMEESLRLAQEALLIAQRSGYVLQGADVNLFLAQYALEQEKDKVKAKAYAETAQKLAHCDDGPPYYYKVAYDEAVAMLEKLK